MKKYFVTGIDTDCGKTIVSAILTEKIKADYWKPVQAGVPTDTDTIQNLTSATIRTWPEGALLKAPMSPHAAAKLENRKIEISGIHLPSTTNTLVIEGAGGLMVPLNDQEMVIELAKKFDAEVILVSKNYLGSINHTLLSINYLHQHKYKIAGIIFNGQPNPESEKIILAYSGLTCLGKIPQLTSLSESSISEAGDKIQLP